MRELPAFRFAHNDRGKSQRPDERLAAAQFVDGVHPAAQDVEKFLFGGQVRIVDESFDELQLGGIILFADLRCDRGSGSDPAHLPTAVNRH